MPLRAVGGLLIVLLACTGLIGFASDASAAIPIAGSASSGPAMVRGAHLSPNTPSIDIYLATLPSGQPQLIGRSLGYGDLSSYSQTSPGSYAVSVRPHGAPSTSPAALGWRFTAVAGHAYTIAVVGLNHDLRGTVLNDDLTTPAAGTGRVRVVQASSRAGQALVFSVRGVGLTTSTAFTGVSAYSTVRAGTWLVRAASVAHPSVATHSRVTVAAGTVTSLLVLDTPHRGIALLPVLDAAAAPTIPNGAVPAGGGGTASRPNSHMGLLALIGAGVIVLILGTVTWLQRRKPSWP